MEEKIRKIIIAIINKTKNNVLKWEQTSIVNQYKIKIGDGTIYIERIDDKENTIFVSILNEDGDPIERISSNNCNKDDKTILIQLFMIILDKTLKKTSTLETIVSALNIEKNNLDEYELDV